MPTSFDSMTSVGTYEAKTHLPALLKRVEAGESITITNHGRPVARLVPVETPTIRPIHQVLDEMLKNRIKLQPGDNIKEWIGEGRR